MNATNQDPLAAEPGYGRADRDGGSGPIGQGTQTLREQRRQMTADVKLAARSFVSRQKDDAATLFSDLAAAVDAFVGVLSDRGRIHTAGYVSPASARLRAIGEELPRRDLNDIVRDVETFARERPVVFASVMLVAGFGAVRFLRSAADHADAATPDTSGATSTDF